MGNVELVLAGALGAVGLLFIVALALSAISYVDNES